MACVADGACCLQQRLHVRAMQGYQCINVLCHGEACYTCFVEHALDAWDLHYPCSACLHMLQVTGKENLSSSTACMQ